MNELHIDLGALVHNLGFVRGLLRKETRLMAIVKADAYGHGLLPVSRALEAAGADFLGVAHVREGLALREGGIRTPVAILSGLHGGEEIAQALDRHLTPVVLDLDGAEALSREAEIRKTTVGVLFKIDTGMGRLGIACDGFPLIVDTLKALKGLRVEGLISHLSSADDPAAEFTLKQIAAFGAAVQKGRALGLDLRFNSLANSAGTVFFNSSHFDMVRPGIVLYGGWPAAERPRASVLKPAMRLSGRILQTKELPRDAAISYGRTYVTKETTRVAVVSAGYGDGLPRSMSNRGAVLIRGKRSPILGTVCMNLIVSDLRGLDEARTGDEVVFLGSQGDETITGDEIARWAGTISYEVFCSVGRSHERTYDS
jgi:alanine racemase